MHLPIRIKILKKTSYFERLAIWVPLSNGIANIFGRKSLAKLTWKINLVNPEGNRVVPDDLEYLVSSDKERRNALSISKLKAAYYPDFGLEELVLSLWIESEREYDISAAFGISHCVVSIKTYTRYGYTFLKEIVLHRADYKEYKILEADFKNLQDYTIVSKPRALIYRVRNNQKKMMRESEVHKFSDGTLTRILEKLDHMVKDFMMFKFNRGMEHIIWSEDDKKRSKEFI
ncbi:hypothetical protein Tco_0051824 [Tanacetum coccineum]